MTSSARQASDRLARVAERIVAARREGARIALGPADAPRNNEEGYAVQDMVVAALASPTVGWKVSMATAGVTFAPLLQSGLVAEGGTWQVAGREPAAIELEIAFRLGRDVPCNASGEQIVDAAAAAHVVFELCQSRIAQPDRHARCVAVSDCICNAGIVIGPAIPHWRSQNLKGRYGRLLIDGKVHAEGNSADPIRALQNLPAALQARGKSLKSGQIVITGSLIGMIWLTGKHDLEGTVAGLGNLRMALAAA
jgi:2-keto-4-pentenoate hydratase